MDIEKKIKDDYNKLLKIYSSSIKIGMRAYNYLSIRELITFQCVIDMPDGTYESLYTDGDGTYFVVDYLIVD